MSELKCIGRHAWRGRCHKEGTTLPPSPRKGNIVGQCKRAGLLEALILHSQAKDKPTAERLYIIREHLLDSLHHNVQIVRPFSKWRSYINFAYLCCFSYTFAYLCCFSNPSVTSTVILTGSEQRLQNQLNHFAGKKQQLSLTLYSLLCTRSQLEQVYHRAPDSQASLNSPLN